MMTKLDSRRRYTNQRAGAKGFVKPSNADLAMAFESQPERFTDLVDLLTITGQALQARGVDPVEILKENLS
ncbi:hypothetical protein LHV02_00370 [Limosilactobacillus fermentum]|uniref:hypothetical protein n=1 Tax=Limosilactobacillus fermentum TaxID=1613 RepID=UPI0016585137|nr:hypothetical protein [Limosilactobacillus fermentum]MCB4715014.1 hypothetical protein [Limosilactobacillus fermentum]MCH5396631.1 hypothetical protein [Limosilactobacillus fermentum]WCL66027.1 hypothetical protein MWLf4_0875 [Limosilactobacillus fermentum]